MLLLSFRSVIFLAAAAVLPAACQQQQAEPEREKIGHHVTELGVHVFGGWINGYSIKVAPEEYALIEHEKCDGAKQTRVPADWARGLCVVRITKEQSDRFSAAMGRFKRNAKPLQESSVVDPFVRPDGKPCRNESTDATGVSLLWTGTEGVKIATFYFGCDEGEFANFYKSVLAVTDPLPIQEIIKVR